LDKTDSRSAAYRECVYCGRCTPCPKGIPIPAVLKLLEQIPVGGEIPQELRAQYLKLPRQAGRCVACKQCESRCPNYVPIVRSMRRASRIFQR